MKSVLVNRQHLKKQVPGTQHFLIADKPGVCCGTSMSSIKRDVKKRVLPRPDAEKIFCLELQPTTCERAPRANALIDQQ